MPEFELIPPKPYQITFEELQDVVADQQMLANIKPQLRVRTRLGPLLISNSNRARGIFVMKERCLILDVGNIDEDDDLIYLNSLLENHSRRIEVVGRRITFHTSVEKLVLREVGRDPANEAVAPRGHALRSGIAKDENARMKHGERNVSDGLVPKAKIVGVELVRIPEPGTDARAIRLEREMPHLIARKAKPLRIAGHSAVQDGCAIHPIKGEKPGHAQRQRQQKQLELDAAPTFLADNRIHLPRARLNRA